MNKRFWFVSKLLTVLFLTLSAYAQVPPNGDSYAQVPPNGDFEQWSGNFPLNWFTSNVPGFFEPVTQSTTLWC
jgi:hypothetical protein